MRKVMQQFTPASKVTQQVTPAAPRDPEGTIVAELRHAAERGDVPLHSNFQLMRRAASRSSLARKCMLFIGSW